jgi:antitoxin YefM
VLQRDVVCQVFLAFRLRQPAGIDLLNVDEYERLKATLEVLSDPELMRQIRASQKFYASRAKGLSFEEVFGEPLTARKQRGRASRRFTPSGS